MERATWDNERCIVGTLDDIADKVKKAKITKCAQILVGDFIDCEYEKSLLYDKTFTHMYREAKEVIMICIISVTEKGDVLARRIEKELGGDLYSEI